MKRGPGCKIKKRPYVRHVAITLGVGSATSLHLCWHQWRSTCFAKILECLHRSRRDLAQVARYIVHISLWFWLISLSCSCEYISGAKWYSSWFRGNQYLKVLPSSIIQTARCSFYGFYFVSLCARRVCSKSDCAIWYGSIFVCVS